MIINFVIDENISIRVSNGKLITIMIILKISLAMERHTMEADD